MTRVLLVDDHPVVREGLLGILTSDPDFQVVGQTESAEEALRLLMRIDADVVLLDVRLPGMSGLDLCARLQRVPTGPRVVVLSSYSDDHAVLDAFAAGAHGFVQKGSTPVLLREAIRAAARGETFVDPAVGRRLVVMATRRQEPRGPFGLTRQELAVLQLFPTGLSYRAIGDKLGVATETVRTHARNIRSKLGVSTKVDAAALALREGLVQSAPKGRGEEGLGAR